MSLGVLNNLNAMYAQSNLNKTQASLSKTLQEMSSGSKINSGADDAAGLSLVNGLQANQTALAQSQTNAQEGVGLLQVADGALSQVTNLLNRAVTLATEVSNGTLNGSQSAAANQEYQSILSEINNIGSTTTYNQNQVFSGAAAGVNIYVGDSSTTGASMDNLHLAALSSATVGDSGGSVVQKSTGQFIDLALSANSVTTKQTAAGDTVSGGIKFTITNADGTSTSFTTTATKVGALVAEINKDGIPGVTASLTTASAAGQAVAATEASTDVGILLTNTNGNVVIANATLLDTTTGEGATTLQASNTGLSTISYQNGANEHTTNLQATDLTTSGNAQAALTQLNSAISDVSAQDGYIGAQINTLNAMSSVMNTQAQNLTAAQNAVQATDYASASSNMAKYEVLSQTGISALAQANSQMQMVTKLLQ